VPLCLGIPLYLLTIARYDVIFLTLSAPAPDSAVKEQGCMKLVSQEQKTLEGYVQKALGGGASYCKVIPASKVVTSEWVRLKCQFGCDAYGKRRTCPPLSPSPFVTRRMLKDFSGAIFVAFRVPDGGVERRLRRKGRRLLASLERELFLDGYYSAFAMGFGPCNICPSCDLSADCKYPEIARPSMEACGIDVYATARGAGFPLRVVRTYEEGCSLCGLVLFGKRDSRSWAASRQSSTASRRSPVTFRKAASRKKEKRNGK
jgi:predicted metal-binding protein